MSHWQHAPDIDNSAALLSRNDTATVRALLRGYRMARGWTQLAAAERAQLDYTLLSKIERGIRTATVGTVKAVEQGWQLTDEERATLRARWWEEA